MTATIYLHADRARLFDLGEKLGFSGEKLSYFSYACCEVKIDLGINPETGAATIIAVDGRALEKAP